MTANNAQLNELQPLKIFIQTEPFPDLPSRKTKNASSDGWFVCQRLTTTHPSNIDPSSIVETVWQVSTVDPSRQRIAVYSGSRTVDSSANDCYANNLHVSFELPDNAQPPSVSTLSASASTTLCWAAFPDMQDEHLVLCCLVTNSSLCIWDVYPRSSTNDVSSWTNFFPSEGWTMSLPFECRAIFSLCDCGGLLLQRADDMEDRVVMTYSQSIEDEGFFLKGPPTLHKQNNNTPSQSAAPTLVMEPQLHLPTAISNAVPSLFSLQHPLEDVIPVVESIVASGRPPAMRGFSPITDVFEQILWVGDATWIDRKLNGESDEHNVEIKTATIVVTYHTILGRHAIWQICDTKIEMKTTPLHQILSSRYHRNHISEAVEANSDIVAIEDLELLQGSKLSSGKLFPNKTARQLPPRLSRVEALADALGVRRTLRKSLDGPSKSRYKSAEQHPMVSSGNLFSPQGTSTSPFNIHSPSKNLQNVSDGGHNISTNSLSTQSNELRSKKAVTCIFKEPNDASCRADSIFMTSNNETGSKLILCLVCQRKSLATRNGSPKELKLFTFNPNIKFDNNDKDDPYSAAFIVQPCKEIIGCLAAQPVSTSTVPSCFTGKSTFERGRLSRSLCASEILVLEKNGILTLYSGLVPITTCYLETPHALVDLINSVGDTVRFRLKDKNHNLLSVLGKLSLVYENDKFVEKILEVIDCGLCGVSSDSGQRTRVTFPPVSTSSSFFKVLSLKIRADCRRLAESLAKNPLHEFNIASDISIASLRTVLLVIAENELPSSISLSSKKNIQKVQNDDAWYKLLSSDYHSSYSVEAGDLFPQPKSVDFIGTHGRKRELEASTSKLQAIRCLSILHLRSIRNKDSFDSNVFARIFDSLHFLYEDSKLFLSSTSESRKLAQLLIDMCAVATTADEHASSLMESFNIHYCRDCGPDLIRNRIPVVPSMNSVRKRSTFRNTFTSFNSPPSIFMWLEGVIKGSNDILKLSGYDHQSMTAVNARCSRTKSMIRVFSHFLKTSDDPNILHERDIAIVNTLIDEGFLKTSTLAEDLPPGLSLPILEVLFRCRHLSQSINLPELSRDGWSLVGRTDISRNMAEGFISRSKHENDIRTDDYVRKDYDNSRYLSSVQSDTDGLLSLENYSAMFFRDDNRIREAARLLRSSQPIFLRIPRAVEVSDHDFERQKQEKLLLLCNRSLALPIGRGMLTIGCLRPIAAEPLHVPEICLKGRVPPANATLTLDTSECPSDMRVWPDFHNGVSAGLRLPINDGVVGEGVRLTRTWIVYNRPTAPVTEETNDAANQQNQQKCYSHGGLLFALGLTGHLTVLEMSDIYEYLTHGTVTTTVGVLLGLAANKRGSCDLSVSKMLCLHIPSLIPQHFSAIDVASCVQAAAIVGAGLLFQRSSHRMMTEFLIDEIGKRPDSDVSTLDREAYTLSCGLALGFVNLAVGGTTESVNRGAGISDLRIEERLLRFISGGVDTEETHRTREANDRFSLPTSAGSDNEKCSTIYESEQINTDMTAPAAILALGLMYIKTGNDSIASAIALPDTHFLLEFVRPDFLGLRVIARALILWDTVLPTSKWIDDQVPLVVRDAYEEMRIAAKSAFSQNTPLKSARQKPEYDRRSIRQIYCHVVAGACFAIGLRYAGTGDDGAKDALYSRVLELYTLKEANDPVSLASRPELPILEMCLCSAAISLSLVLAGTGNLDALKLFKVLRWRCDKTSSFGSHMMYGMAIGMLFLGGGACTVGREPEDIACLITAFFPRFPVTTSDNQYHLQALRHLYVLSVKRRDIRAIDVDSGSCVFVPVNLAMKSHTKIQSTVLPSLLRNTEEGVKHIRLDSDSYYPLTVDISKCEKSVSFYVKRRRESTSTFFGGMTYLKNDVKLIKHCENTILMSSRLDPNKTVTNRRVPDSSCKGFGFLSLPECLTDRTDGAIVYVSLRNSLSCLLTKNAGDIAALLRNLNLLRTYYRQRRRIVGKSDAALLNTELILPYIEEMIEIFAPTEEFIDFKTV